MYLLIALLACGGDDTTQPTDAPQIEANVAGGDGAPQGNMGQNPGNMNQGGNGQPGQQGPGSMNAGQENMGQAGGENQGGENQGGENQGGENSGAQEGTGNGPSGDMNAPNNGENIGAAVPPEDGQNIGDPNVPPDTINQTVGKDGETPPQPMEMGDSSGTQKEPQKKPPTFIYNAHSEDSGPLYKTEDGSCFVRKNWDQPNNGVMGDTEERDCPQQMASDAWKNCPNGRLVKHNVGDKEGTCECEPIVSGEAVAVDCP